MAEVQEMQVRLTKAGFDTGGTDGRVGNDTMKAIQDFQVKAGLVPADGYGGLKVLARLRQGSLISYLSRSFAGRVEIRGSEFRVRGMAPC